MIKKLFNSPKKIVIAIVVVLLLIFGLSKLFGKKTTSPQYLTAQAEKGTLITSVTASGNVTAGDTVEVTTTASGFANQVYVKVGDTVSQGQKIADVTLDRDGQQRLASAYANYLSAQNQLTSAQISLYSLQSSMFTKWQTFTNLSENSTYTNSDGSPNVENRTLPQFITSQDDWLATEAQYKNQQNVIAQSQATANNALLNYQIAQPSIIAPSSGVIANLTIAQGVPITITTSTSTTNNSSSSTPQTVATIRLPQGKPLAVVNIAEIDAAKVKAGQKVTLTLDAFTNQTFTGHVLIVDTSGTVSSGVTNYPATIAFDTENDSIYPNMGVNASIITKVKDNAILVPSAAVQTTNGESTVRIMKNGSVTSTVVELGDSNDTQTEIISGIKEGDTIVTGSTQTTSSNQSNSSSPFSAFGNRGAGGAAVRVGGR
jgi:membrane fusion protein, macrolide-specific efflux system